MYVLNNHCQRVTNQLQLIKVMIIIIIINTTRKRGTLHAD
jgi:hypothetical protein